MGEANGTVTNLTLQQMNYTLRSDETIQYIADLFDDSMNLYNKIKENLTDESRSLFGTHILLQQSIHYHCNLILQNTYLSAVAYNALNYELASKYVQSSYDHFGKMFADFRNYGEQNQFRGFYLHSRIADFQACRANYRRLYVLVNNTKH